MEFEAGGQNADANTATNTPPLMEQAKQKTQEVVHITQQKAGEAMGQAGEQIKSRLEETKSSAADNLSGMADAIRSSSQHIRERPDAAPVAQKVAGFADSAAEAVQHVSQYLREKNVDEVVTEVEGFARRQPAVFLGSAVALGFLAARFLKSSNPNPTAQGAQFGAGTQYLPPARPYETGTADTSREMRSSYDPASSAA
jgi:hypothetical protein